MLRASAIASGEDAELSGIVNGAVNDSGVAHGALLLAFAEAAIGHNMQTIDATREALQHAAGEAAMIDAAGVIANFQRMVRIADGTGIPLDETVVLLTEDIRDSLSLNEYGSASRTPQPGIFRRGLARLVKPLFMFMIKRSGRRSAG